MGVGRAGAEGGRKGRRKEGARRGERRLKEGEGKAARAFCNFYNLNSAAAGATRNYSNPRGGTREPLRVYF